jgi:hypothetical protein
MPDWQSRIVGHGEEAPDQLLANPKNWRIHPKSQQSAMEAVLDKVGWVQDVIVNRQTGNMIDGHMRVSLADRRNEKTVPVVYVDLSPEEEDLVLATLDPLGDLAATDRAQLSELLGELDRTTMVDELASLLVELEPDPGSGGKPLMDLSVGGAAAQLEQLVYYPTVTDAAVIRKALDSVAGETDTEKLVALAQAHLDG